MTPERIAGMNELQGLEMRLESIECCGELTLPSDLEAIHALMAKRAAVLAKLGGEPSINDWTKLREINHHAAEGLRICRNI
jgi:hypothetical protein